jgi:thymidylate synthase
MKANRIEEAHYELDKNLEALNLLSRFQEEEKELKHRKNFEHKKSEPFCIYHSVDAEGIHCTIGCGFCYGSCRHFYGYECKHYVAEADKDTHKIIKIVNILERENVSGSKEELHKIAKEINKIYKEM